MHLVKDFDKNINYILLYKSIELKEHGRQSNQRFTFKGKPKFKAYEFGVLVFKIRKTT